MEPTALAIDDKPSIREFYVMAFRKSVGEDQTVRLIAGKEAT
jgi:hypothetical protein